MLPGPLGNRKTGTADGKEATAVKVVTANWNCGNFIQNEDNSMLKFISLLLFMLQSPQQEGSGATGIFLTIDCRKDMPRKVELISNKYVCLPQNPIIYPVDFSSIGPLQEASDKIFFELSFTPKGHQTLIKVTANLPDTKLALVVNNEVFFVFKTRIDQRAAPKIRFVTVIRNKAQAETAHRQLEEAIEAASSRSDNN